MAHRTVHLACLVSLLALTSATKEQTRWSRQLSTYTSDISDWVPLWGPVEKDPAIEQPQIKRQAVAEPRILTEPFPGITRPSAFSADAFSSRNYFNTASNKQLYLQSVPSVPSAPQNFLTDQGFGQSIRFGLSQPNFPLSQGFVAPQFAYDTVPPHPKPVRPQIPTNQINFGHAPALPLPVQGKPFLHQAPKSNLDAPKFVDGYRAENASNEFAFPSKKPQSLQKIKYEIGERGKGDILPQNSKSEREEEVQLLYVPLHQLNKGHFNFRRPMQPGFFDEYQKPGVPGIDPYAGTNHFSSFNSHLKELEPKYTTPFTTLAPVTPKPKKLKPHQPPLAIFVIKDVNKHTQVKVGDVLSSLKNAETIAVLDSVNPLNAPKVFIGPSNLPPPENFVKFELPYLSNIEHSDNKIKQLPFFVAPLSYNTPNGFAKIPFPSPHVGSVVINSQIKETAQPPSQPGMNTYYNVVTPPTRKVEPPTQKPTFSYYSTAAPNSKPNYQTNYYSFEPQTVSSLRPPTHPETQTSPTVRPPPQPQIQTIPPIRPPSHSQPVTVPPVRPPSQPETQTAPPKTGSFFFNSPANQYNPAKYSIFPSQNNFKSSEAIDQFNFPRQPEYTPLKTSTTTSTTTKPPSTYPSQLLETHNPYSINQAFHFSTPLDYHNYFDDVKQPHVTPGHLQPPPTPAPASTSHLEPRPEKIATEKPIYQQSSPSYLNNYTPEIHYDSDQNLKYPVYNPNEYVGKTEVTSQQTQPSSPADNVSVNQYTTNADTQLNNDKYSTNADVSVPAVNNYNVNNYHNKYETNVDTNVNNYKTDIDSSGDNYNTNNEAHGEIYKNKYKQNDDVASSNESGNNADNIVPTVESNTQQKYDEYNAYSNSEDAEDTPSSSTSTTTTTTRRTPLRARGRPRYTTTPRSDSYESTARVVVTRRPLRERRPLPTRPRYEPNKISTEKPIRKPLDSSETTTKSPRSRTRGRIHYKPDNEDGSYDRKKTHNTKEQDLAYQRDVLHQNYPVTLMERGSTVDIEAMTEPTVRQSSVKDLESVSATETVDTENAYTNERVSISEQEEVKDGTPLPSFTARNTLQTETPYVPNLPSTRNDEYFYQPRSSIAPVEASAFEETSSDTEEDIYAKQTTPVPKPTKSEPISYATEAADAEQNAPNYSSYNEYATVKQEDITTVPETEGTKAVSQESQEIYETKEEENIVQTTPSYNRVRVRTGAIRQYHQASSTESSRIKERRRPSQPVTYRPALGRRTTMRIDEIEADLKTKQVHSRSEQEYKHPVYKPEPSTEPAIAPSSSTESTTKRGHFRRRKPSYTYTTTSTEATSTKRVYEVKSRFKGRRPTDKPTEKSDSQTEAPTSTTRSSLHSRYSHRPRLSERYNKKPEPVVEDQDSNDSINRPKYIEPDTDQWSPKISVDSFKPYNPNDIVDEYKIATTERRSDKESELDIITARNEFEDILLTVTPATNNNNRMNKKIPDIPPTLEAIVEQSKVTKSDASDTMSTFETMLEEVMKNLEEQDKDEYNSNVMKHKGGEIGEIPPERIISSEDGYVLKSTTPLDEVTTEPTTSDDSPLVNEDEQRGSRRRGFWKKVKVRPASAETIQFAESQYYTNTVNRLGQPINEKTVHEKSEKIDKPKVTTYKPKFELKDLIPSGDDASNIDVIPTLEIQKINSTAVPDDEESLISEESKKTTVYIEKETQTASPGDLDLGTGSPDPTIDDSYFTTPTEPTPTKAVDTFSIIDFLFGDTTQDNEKQTTVGVFSTTQEEIETTEQPKSKTVTTENGFIPEEITASSSSEDTNIPEYFDIKKIEATENSRTDTPTEETAAASGSEVESSSISSFMDPANVLSTSMSTEISHETEICYRGKCIKSNSNLL